MKDLLDKFCSHANLGMDLLNKNLRKTLDPENSICTFQIRTKNSLTLEKVGSFLAGIHRISLNRSHSYLRTNKKAQTECCMIIHQ